MGVEANGGVQRLWLSNHSLSLLKTGWVLTLGVMGMIPGRQEPVQKQVANSKFQGSSSHSFLDNTLINYIYEKDHWPLLGNCCSD